MRIEAQIANAKPRPRVAVHKFTSCDGCQLAFLNAGEALIELTELVDFVHFAEMGVVAPDVEVDIAFVEGSVSTHKELDRIKHIRANSRYVISIGACATSGGLQALRNMHNTQQWIADVYSSPEVIDSLTDASAISKHIRVDLELWGCPVNQGQIIQALRALLFGVTPSQNHEPLCLECKRVHHSCVMVTQGKPCMGPVTKTGCGAICPRYGRDCYACFGPAENSNGAALGKRFEGLGLMSDEVVRRFQFINSQAAPFSEAVIKLGSGNE